MEQRPNQQEIQFLTVSYNFFLDVFEEIKEAEFWSKDSYYRLSRIKDAFLTYSEILEYKPITWVLEDIKQSRPPMEAELSKEFCLFVRNLLIHFPFFKSWSEVRFNKALINWSIPGRTIDKFMTKYSGHKEVKYRTWYGVTKTMTYVTINFPPVYDEKTEISLTEFMPEKEGVTFVLLLMYRVLMSQIESISPVDSEK